MLPVLVSNDKRAYLGKYILKQPIVLASSRPITIPQEIYNPSQKYELIELKEECVKKSIYSYLSSINKLNKFDGITDYLEHQPSLMSIIKVPLNLALVCSIIINEKGDFNTGTNATTLTMTRLYEKWMNSLRKRYYEEKLGMRMTYELFPNQIARSETQVAFNALEKMALTLVINKSSHINSRILKKVLADSPPKFLLSLHQLGFLKWYGERDGQSISIAEFNHLINRDFLAAHKITNCISSNSRIEFIQFNN